jgi:ABC-type lipoprotein export system ATPase subunit
MADTILSCSHVTKRFVSRGRTTDVLSDIGLVVHSGQTVVIRGRSGTGKSTLLQLLAGLDHPTAGQLEIAGRNLADLGTRELTILRRRIIGFIFQNFNLISSWTAGENVEAALLHTPLTRPGRHRKVCEMLEKLELSDRIDHLPSELSVGQQQRVAIARALIHGPAIVFADEPTGDVDPETAKAILETLARLVRENQTAFVICTHGEFTLATADQRYRLHDGGIESVSSEPPLNLTRQSCGNVTRDPETDFANGRKGVRTSQSK